MCIAEKIVPGKRSEGEPASAKPGLARFLLDLRRAMGRPRPPVPDPCARTRVEIEEKCG